MAVGMPTRMRQSLIASLKNLWDTGFPPGKMNNSPSFDLCTFKYRRAVWTGQDAFDEADIVTDWRCPLWCFKEINVTVNSVEVTAR